MNEENKSAMSSELNMHQIISNMIKENDVVLFMKGKRYAPKCGFSKSIVDTLTNVGITVFKDIDVLEDEEIRKHIKIYSNWPTIPQLYIKEEFIGGCDIVAEMYESGSLKNLVLNLGLK